MKEYIAYCGLDCETCGSCSEMESCEKLAMITNNNEAAMNTLKGLS